MCVGSPTAWAWSSFQRRPDDEFETDRRHIGASMPPRLRGHAHDPVGASEVGERFGCSATDSVHQQLVRGGGMRRSPADSTDYSLAAFGKLQHIPLERARCHTRQTRCTPYARRVEIEWAPFIASTSAGPKGRPPPTGPPSRRAVRSPSVTHRSWLTADDWPRPGRPAPGSSGWPGLRPETDPATARPAPP